MDSSTIQVSIEVFDNLTDFVKLTPTERTRVIRVGLDLVEHSQTLALNEADDEWSAKLAELRKTNEQSLKEVRDQCSHLQKKLDAQSRDFQSEKAELAARIKENAFNAHQAEIDNLRQQNAQLNDTIQSQSGMFQTKLDETLREWRTHHDNTISAERANFDSQRQVYEDKINSLIGRTQNSTIRGQEGETELFATLNRLFPTALIEDTHTIPGRGDFILQIDGLTMMLENKNYTRNVQKSEVDKFYRDMESSSNSDLQCGVLISMNCGISCKEDFSVEVRNGKPVMFLHNIVENPKHIKLAVQLFQVLLAHPATDLSNTEEVSKIANIAKAVKRNFVTQRKQLDKYFKDQSANIDQQQGYMIELFGLLKMKY